MTAPCSHAANEATMYSGELLAKMATRAPLLTRHMPSDGVAT